MKIGLIQGSLNPNSKTSLLTELTEEKLSEQNISYYKVDLRNINMDFCNGSNLEDYNEDIQNIYKNFEECTSFIIGMPVYQYSIAGPLKNFLDLTSISMANKPFSVVTNSGSTRSFLSCKELISILFFEISAIPIPPIAHTALDMDIDTKENKTINKKIDKIIENLQKYDNN